MPVSKKEYDAIYRKNNLEKCRAATRKWGKDNAQLCCDRTKAWRKANPEKKKALNKKWAEENPEKVVASAKKWRQNNLWKGCADTAKYNAAKIQRTPKWANLKKIERIYQLAQWASKFTDEPLEVDHIIPLRGKNVSGLHVENNLQILTKSENCAKGNRYERV